MDNDVAEVHRDLLAAAVAASRTWRDVLRRLGLADTDERVAQVVARTDQLGVSTGADTRSRWNSSTSTATTPTTGSRTSSRCAPTATP
jgi:succinylarginine dihydrolase